MKVLTRIFVKLLILVMIIAGVGGAVAAWNAYQQSTPDDTMETYLSYLIDNKAEQAYAWLDQSEQKAMTEAEYAKALDAGDYVLYSGYRITKGDLRRGESGQEYLDYHVKFLNAADEVKLEDDFTVKKQSTPIFGVFDSWKVMSDHCLIQDYEITVPAGAELYLNNELADSAWITEDETAPFCDHYVIPYLIPDEITVTIRHDVLKSVTAVIDVTKQGEDYSGKMELKESAKGECTELGVLALKTLFSGAASGALEEKETLFSACQKSAEQFVTEQAKIFADSMENFKQIAISDFAPHFSEPVFEEAGAIQCEMTLAYRRVVREEVTYESGDYLEDGTAEYLTETVEHAANETAKMTMRYEDGAWQIAAISVPLALQQDGQTE